MNLTTKPELWLALPDLKYIYCVAACEILTHVLDTVYISNNPGGNNVFSFHKEAIISIE